MEVSQHGMDFQYTLCEGKKVEVPNYGLLLAKVAGVPDVVSQDATEIVRQLKQKEQQRERVSFAHAAEWRMLYSIAHRLNCLRHAKLPLPELRQQLQAIQDELRPPNQPLVPKLLSALRMPEACSTA